MIKYILISLIILILVVQISPFFDDYKLLVKRRSLKKRLKYAYLKRRFRYSKILSDVLINKVYIEWIIISPLGVFITGKYPVGAENFLSKVVRRPVKNLELKDKRKIEMSKEEVLKLYLSLIKFTATS